MSRERPSRSQSRVPLSRAHSQASSVAYLPGGADTLVVPDGPIGAQAAELLGNIVGSPNHESEGSSSTLVRDSDVNTLPKVGPNSDNSAEPYEDDEEERLEQGERARRPFYRRPSPWWMLVTVATAAVAMSTTIAPRVEVYTKLACQALRPEYTIETAEVKMSAWDTVTPPSRQCAEDPDVQAAVAKLITIMAVSMGILSCFTTGWWGQLSDRYGRTRMLGIAACGILISDFNFILVSLAADRLPGGYRFLLVGPVIDGLLGGMTSLTACLHAYISDCTPPEARSRIFSLSLGLLFAGVAFGPALGGLIVAATNDLLSVFYLATATHLFYTFFIVFVIPESLTRTSMRHARKRREAFRSEEVGYELAPDQPFLVAFLVVLRARTWNTLKKLFAFLTPLGVFLPYRRQGERGRHWGLTLLVFSYGCTGLLMGSYQFKFQYAQRAFGWNSEAMGYWLSVVGIVRALYLVIILPLVIKYFNPKPAPIQLPVSPSEPLHPSRAASPENTSVTTLHPSPGPRGLKHSPTFDLALARISLLVELICYIGMTLAASSISWTVASMFAALSAGYSPAMQSVALALYERGPNQGIETGRLFGGLSVVQALSTQILGPSLFGLTYVSTVNIFPKGIFVLAAGAVASALLFMSLVRLPGPPPKMGHEREETAVENEQDLVGN